MLNRKDFEDRELRELAPYAMLSAKTRGRHYPEPEHPLRSVYQRDRDRIIHSAAFRRLEYKTQVFVNDEGDHHRTRLTHSLEVAQIARTISRAMRLNEDLSEAVSLAHDLGHTPFGHTGEEALRELMINHGGFEHNRQSLRVVDFLEKKYVEFPGLNLAWETRESIIKHTTHHDHPMDNQFEPQLRPLLESQIVEVADEIAYDNHDLDDGLRAGIISENELSGIAQWDEAFEAVARQYTNLDLKIHRALAIRHLINFEVTDIITNSERLLKENDIDSVEDVRRVPIHLIAFSEEVRERKHEMENYLKANMYQYYRVARMADKAKRFITALFLAYQSSPRSLPPEYQKRAQTEGLERVLCDYIAGMTDRFAQDEYKRLFHPFERV